MPDTIRFNNLSGAHVQVATWLLTRRWTCHGCGLYGPATLSRKKVAKGGNDHAATCRAVPR